MNRILYIGLNGYAGAGKDTVAEMLNDMLNFQYSSKEEGYDKFMEKYNGKITATFPSRDAGPNSFCIAFADKLKYVCSVIFGVPIDYFYNAKATSWICINKGFEFTEVKPHPSKILTASDYYNGRDGYQNSKEKLYMSLREILVYVGTYVLQESISNDIFINLVSKEIKERCSCNEYKYVICTDVRFLSEMEFIKKNHGIMVNIVRDSIKQLNNIAEHDLDDEEDFDYVIENNGTYQDLYFQIWDIVHENKEWENICLNLFSHDGSDNYLILKESKEEENKIVLIWELVTEYGACRVSHNDGNIVFIDPSGGPMISIGNKLNTICHLSFMSRNHVITKIWFDEITGKPKIMTEQKID